MARYRVQAPDGKIVIIEGPDGADEATVMRQAQALYRTPAKQTPKSQPAKKKSVGEKVLDYAGGAVANFNSQVPFLQDIEAGIQTVARDPVNALQAGLPFAPGLNQRAQAKLAPTYREERQKIRDNNQRFSEEAPYAAATARGAGMGAALFVPGPKVTNALVQPVTASTAAGRAAQVGGNVARSGTAAAASGAAYGLGGPGETFKERVDDAAINAASGFALGGAMGAVGSRGPKPAKRAAAPSSTKAKATTLRESGVSLTPGQQMGGLAKNAEDLAMRAPILGPAIGGARQRGVESLNRAVGLRALNEIGEDLPRNVDTGFEAVKHVRERLGKVYDDAADLVPSVAPDEQFSQGLQAVRGQLGDLSETSASQFESILANRLGRLQPGVSGRTAMQVADEIEGLAAKAQVSDDLSQQLMGERLGDVAHEIRALIARTNPEAGAMIQQADKGWAIFARMRNAASKGVDGVFTPGQLRTAVRMEDGSVAKGRAAEGEALLQDLSNASTIMPDQFGNPGTANAVGLGAGGIGMLTNPGPTVAAAAGLAGAATPYFLMGRKVLERLPPNANPQQIAEAEQELAALVAKDPSVRQLQAMLAERFARASGAVSATATSGQ